MIPYVERVARDLDLEMPQPVTTNRVSRFYPYRGYGQGAGIWVDSNRWVFAFDVKRHFIYAYSDRKHCLRNLSGDALKSLTNSPAITQEQALELARKYLVKLGYSEDRFPVSSPNVRQEKPWPIFTVEWPWTPFPERTYFSMEIDGLRLRVDDFLTTYGSPAEESLTNAPTAN